MEKETKILIVDDETAPRKNLKKLIKNYSKGFSVVGEAEDALSGLKQIAKLKPDLIILDIEMPGGNGFELLDCITEKHIPFIFTTAHNQYALKAFRYDAVDYILKPVDIDLLLGALEKAREKLVHRDPIKPNSLNSLAPLRKKGPLKLSIHSQNETEYLDIGLIVRLEASGCYTNIFLDGGRKLTVSKPLREYEYLLEEENFTRVHNSHMVNMAHIRKFVKKDGFMVKMTDDCQVPIAVRRKDIFEQKLKLVAI